MANDQHDPVDDAALAASLLAVLRVMFPDARWDDVEQHAAHAWRSIAWRTGRTWSDVRAALRAAWETLP